MASEVERGQRVLLTEPDSDEYQQQKHIEIIPGTGDEQVSNKPTADEAVVDSAADTKKGTDEDEKQEPRRKLSKDVEGPVFKQATEDPYTKAVKYMEMHNVMQIFQHLTSEIVYHRPLDPLNYMLEELQRMRETRSEEEEEAAAAAKQQ